MNKDIESEARSLGWDPDKEQLYFKEEPRKVSALEYMEYHNRGYRAFKVTEEEYDQLLKNGGLCVGCGDVSNNTPS